MTTFLAAFAPALLLVVIANSAPWAAGRLMRQRLDYPLDCGARWPDGVPVLGSHKTWRGLVAAVLACGVTAEVMGLGYMPGLGFGALAMLGDSLSSAVKRRLKLAPGREVFGIDQLAEALLPLCALSGSLGLTAWGVASVTFAFLILDVSSSRLRRSGIQ